MLFLFPNIQGPNSQFHSFFGPFSQIQFSKLIFTITKNMIISQILTGTGNKWHVYGAV